MGDERCNYKYGRLITFGDYNVLKIDVSECVILNISLDCSGKLVDRNTPSYSFYETFPNSVVKEMWCEMEIDNGGWIVSTILQRK